jgi:hypothetical protein
VIDVSRSPYDDRFHLLGMLTERSTTLECVGALRLFQAGCGELTEFRKREFRREGIEVTAFQPARQATRIRGES